MSSAAETRLTNKTDIVIFGAGGHAKVVVDIVEAQDVCHISCIIDHNCKSDEFLGYPLLHEFSPSLPQAGIIAIGDNFVRAKVATDTLERSPNFRFVTAVHPSATVSRRSKVGSGTVIMPGVRVNSSTTVGQHCILNTNASVDHDNVIQNYVTVGPGATTGGNVTLEEFSMLGLGASCIHRTVIGKHAVVGAGSVVVRSIPSFSVAYGTPCRVHRMREAGDKYL